MIKSLTYNYTPLQFDYPWAGQQRHVVSIFMFIKMCNPNKAHGKTPDDVRSPCAPHPAVLHLPLPPSKWWRFPLWHHKTLGAQSIVIERSRTSFLGQRPENTPSHHTQEAGGGSISAENSSIFYLTKIIYNVELKITQTIMPQQITGKPA